MDGRPGKATGLASLMGLMGLMAQPAPSGDCPISGDEPRENRACFSTVGDDRSEDRYEAAARALIAASCDALIRLTADAVGRSHCVLLVLELW